MPRPSWPRDFRQWQVEALDAWFDASCVGVVQAVTGTGKTRVGIEAARWHVANGGNVLILVPSRALLAQWHRQLVSEFSARAGQRGDGHKDTFRTRSVIVSTVHSAIDGLDLRGRPGLLIADECHRYGAGSWSQALDPDFGMRLGLSATYQRGDSGDADYLHPYFGADPVFDIDFRRAIDDRVVVPFRLAFVGVPLTGTEREAYDENTEEMSLARRRLVNQYGLPAEPPAEFMKAVARAAQGEEGIRVAMVAQRYVSAFSKRRAVLADSTQKLKVLEQLHPAMNPDAGTLVFTQTKAAAEESASRVATATGRKAAAIYGDLEGSERERLLEAFRERSVSVLSAPRVLDEGIDVPDADLGIVVASSSSRRQMIQRMGRVLRLAPEKKRARLVVLFAEGTVEDPANGAHEGFVQLAWDVAEQSQVFRNVRDISVLMSFLCPDWTPGVHGAQHDGAQSIAK
jgi:RNA polymerase primary sigma factor